jgi:small multidrug resistance pump
MPTWLLLALAIAFEVTATMCLRAADGFTKLLPSLVVVIGYGVSFFLLSLILRTGIPSGIIYAIWSAFGVTFVTLLGMAFFDDRISLLSGIGMAIIVIGVVLVELGTRAHGA